MQRLSIRSTGTRRHDVLAIVILTVLPALLFLDILTGRGYFFGRDLANYFYPARTIMRDIVLGGEFPFWNRFFGAGQPMASNPEHEVFYPLTWMILLPDFLRWSQLQILLHVWIGLVGMYAFLRTLKLRASSSLFGAISFGTGGMFLSYVNIIPWLFAAAWMPLICLFTRSFLLRPRLRSFALASFLFGLQILVGEPTTIVQTGFLLGMYALYRGWSSARESGGKWTSFARGMLVRVGGVALITLAAAAVGAVQLLPAIDLIGDSVRSRLLSFATVSTWSMPWTRLGELFYPNWLGYVERGGRALYWQAYGVKQGPYIFSIYNGLLVGVLALAGILSRIRGYRLVLALCAFSVLIATGANGPLLEPLFRAGVIRSIRYPEKFILLASFSMTVFAAIAFDRLRGGDARVRKAVLGIAAVTGFIAVAMAAAAFTPAYARAFGGFFPLARGSELALQASREGWIAAAFRGLVLLALLASGRWVSRNRLAAGMLVFAVFDVAIVTARLNPRLPGSFFRKEPPAARSLPRDRDRYRIFNEAELVRFLDRNADVRNYSPSHLLSRYVISRNSLLPYNACSFGLQMVMEVDYDLTALHPTGEFFASMRELRRSGRPDWWRPLAAMSNVAWYGNYQPFAAEVRRIGGDLDRIEPVRFTSAGDNPRYWFADRIVAIRGRRDFVEKLSRGGFGDRTAFVTGTPFVPAAGMVKGWRETANTATIDVEADGRSLLVMSVTPHRYWRVTVDGRPARTRSANIGYQALELPPGKHTVRMRYSNPVIVRSSWLSAATVLFLLAGMVMPSAARPSAAPAGTSVDPDRQAR